MRTLVSIHDVMPSTLDSVRKLLDTCLDCGTQRITLLVVPGMSWSVADLDVLRGWERAGHELAAHGWQHRCRQINTWFHRLHSRLISRQVAEHLSLASREAVRLMQRSYDWFVEHDFMAPRLYVPPAWALGPVRSQQLGQLPFATIETLTSVYLTRQAVWRRLPLAGFEADTRWRCCALTCLNYCSTKIARMRAAPLRVALHPFDLQLGLSRHIERTLRASEQALSYSELDC